MSNSETVNSAEAVSSGEVVNVHPVIDVHAHWGPWFFAMDIGDVTENLRVMHRWGISRQIVSAAEAVVYDAPSGNARLARVLPEAPALSGYLVVNPVDPDASSRDLQRHSGNDQFVGVKIHTTYPGAAINSPQMRETFAMLDERRAIVLIHTWGPDVLDLVPLLETNRQVRVIAGHMAAARWDLAIEAATANDRIYLEPSCSNTEAGQVRDVAASHPDRLLFGTDTTLIDPAVSFGLVADARLTEPELERVLWRNAADLFGWPDPRDQRAG